MVLQILESYNQLRKGTPWGRCFLGETQQNKTAPVQECGSGRSSIANSRKRLLEVRASRKLSTHYLVKNGKSETVLILTVMRKIYSSPRPSEFLICPTCQDKIWLADGLRIHEQFVENQEVGECQARFRDALEILALINALRHLVKSENGRQAIGNTAFVMDGPLAAFGTIAVLAKAVREEFRRIQKVLTEKSSDSTGLVRVLHYMFGAHSCRFFYASENGSAPGPGSKDPSESRMDFKNND